MYLLPRAGRHSFLVTVSDALRRIHDSHLSRRLPRRFHCTMAWRRMTLPNSRTPRHIYQGTGITGRSKNRKKALDLCSLHCTTACIHKRMFGLRFLRRTSASPKRSHLTIEASCPRELDPVPGISIHPSLHAHPSTKPIGANLLERTSRKTSDIDVCCGCSRNNGQVCPRPRQARDFVFFKSSAPNRRKRPTFPFFFSLASL